MADEEDETTEDGHVFHPRVILNFGWIARLRLLLSGRLDVKVEVHVPHRPEGCVRIWVANRVMRPFEADPPDEVAPGTLN